MSRVLDAILRHSAGQPQAPALADGHAFLSYAGLREEIGGKFPDREFIIESYPSKGIRRAMYLYIDEPLDTRGTRYMEIRYLDVNKPEDVWVWFPLFRRIRRMGYAYKSDTIDGTDLGPDDENGWNGHVNRKTWEIAGRKEMLLGRHTDTTKYTKTVGQANWNGLQL